MHLPVYLRRGLLKTGFRAWGPHPSVPILHLRPDLAQRPPRPAAIEDIEMLVGHGIWVINGGDFPDIGELRFEIPHPSGHDDNAFAGVAARSPEEVALMAADGGRQTVFRTE